MVGVLAHAARAIDGERVAGRIGIRIERQFDLADGVERIERIGHIVAGNFQMRDVYRNRRVVDVEKADDQPGRGFLVADIVFLAGKHEKGNG